MPDPGQFLPADYLTDEEILAARGGSDPSFGETVGAAVTTETIPAWIGREIAESTLEGEPDYSDAWAAKMELDEGYWKSLTEGIKPEYWSEFAGAISDHHAKVIREKLLITGKAEDTLARAGWGGIAAKLGANIFDPAAVLMDVAGAGIANRLNKSLKIGRLARYAKAGLVTAGEETVIEGIRSYLDPSRGADDVAWSALGAFGAGSGMARLLDTKKVRLVRQLAIDAQKELEFREAVEFGLFLKRLENGLPAPEVPMPNEFGEFIGNLTGYVPKTGSRSHRAGNALGATIHGGPPLSAREVAEKLGINRKEAKKVLGQMEQAGLIESVSVERVRLDGEPRMQRQYRLSQSAIEQVLPVSGNDAEAVAFIWQDLLGEDLQNASSGIARYHHARFGVSARVGTDPLPDVRRLGRMMMQDVLPDADDARSVGSATEYVSRQQKIFESAFYGVAEPALGRWYKRNDVGFWQRAGMSKRNEFFEQVTEAVRRKFRNGSIAEFDEEVQEVAKAISGLQNDMLNAGRKAGLTGFDEIIDNPGYMTRMPSARKIERLFMEIGEDNTRLLLKNAILEEMVELTDEQAATVAEGYLKHVIKRHYATDLDNARVFAGADVEKLEHILRTELDIDEEYLQDILNATTRRKKNSGTISRAKHRLGMNEMYAMKAFDDDGALIREIRIDEIFENNAEELVTKYARDVHGAIAERKILEAMAEEGEAAAPSFETVIKRLEAKAAAEKLTSKGLKKKFDRDIDRLRSVHKLILGLPMGNDTRFARTLQFLRKYAYLRVGNKFGLAQVPEIGNLMGEAGFRAMAQTMPSLRKMWLRGKAGKWTDETLQELQAILGAGSDRLRRHAGARHVNMGLASNVTEAAGGRTSHLLDQGARVTNVISGMDHINQMLQLAAAKTAMQRMVNHAFDARMPNARRLLSMGLSEDDANRIFKQIRKHATTDKGMLGRTYRKMNLDDWDDQWAAAKLTISVDKWSRRVIQENDIGQLSMWMTSDLGRTLLQFRAFNIASWEKQFLHGIYVRDWNAFSGWMNSIFWGSLTYMGLQYSNAIGRQDANEYLNERMTMGEIGKGAFQRAGWFSMFPGAIDSVLRAGQFDPMFAYGRTTGQATNIVTGTPIGDMITKAGTATSGTFGSIINPNRRMTERDVQAWMSLTPFYNAFVYQNGLNLLAKSFDLPKRGKTGG